MCFPKRSRKEPARGANGGPTRRVAQGGKLRRTSRDPQTRHEADFANLYVQTQRGLRNSGHIMSIIGAIFIGLIVGIIAKSCSCLDAIRAAGSSRSCWASGGSLVAGYLGRALGWYQDRQPVGFLTSIVGAIILLALYRVDLAESDSWRSRRSACGNFLGLGADAVRRGVRRKNHAVAEIAKSFAFLRAR